ncbi:MAG TPA: LysR substrate-binding domain-containing protein [Steroidobacteraceae bacterium]
MKLTQLRDVVTVGERGSLRGAARHLGLAQPAITRSIREIERELGVPLFERQAKGMVLTPMGERFVLRARTVQDELRRAREEIDQLRGQTTGRVTVGLSTVSHIALLPRSLQTFRTRYPDVLLDIEESLYPNIEIALITGKLDFYVGPLPETPLPKDLAAEKLFDNKRVVLARKGHALSGARSLRELVDANWITTSVTTQRSAELGPLFEHHGLAAPKVRMQAHSALTMIMAAAHSDLLAMMPQQWRDSPWSNELLQVIEVEELLTAAAMHIVKRTRLPLTPAAEYLCDLLRRAKPPEAAPLRALTQAKDRKLGRRK